MGKLKIIIALLAASALTPSCALRRIDRADTLIASARAGNVEATKGLIDKGFDVKIYGFHGLTPLMAAAENGNLEMCRLLLDRGADINAHNDSGSVLFWAVDSGSRELVVFLLGRGADPTWKNRRGINAADLAVEMSRPGLAVLLK